MRHSHRMGTNKHKSAGKFRRDVGKTHPRNIQIQPRRGGWRL